MEARDAARFPTMPVTYLPGPSLSKPLGRQEALADLAASPAGFRPQVAGSGNMCSSARGAGKLHVRVPEGRTAAPVPERIELVPCACEDRNQCHSCGRWSEEEGVGRPFCT